MSPICWQAMKLAVSLSAVALWLGAAGPALGAAPATSPARWWKGNIHTHSKWSDGAEAPEVVARRYKERGYHFLAITDHDTMQSGERWAAVANGNPHKGVFTPEQLQRYQADFGADWVKTRATAAGPQVRLRAFDEYRGRFEQPGRFLLIQGIETEGPRTNHIVTLNHGPSSAGGPESLVVLAHPMWERPFPIEELWEGVARHIRFFEVMNELPHHPWNVGTARTLSGDRFWDICLTKRLEQRQPLLFATAADDSHDLAKHSGGGWIAVHAPELTWPALRAAFEQGEFYASTGVTLRQVVRRGKELSVAVEPEAGVTYTIEFIGTRPGYPKENELARDASGALLPPTLRYSAKIGQVLRKVDAPAASYACDSGELYVRARITSSKPKREPDSPGAFETAWTQPLAP